MSNTVFRVSCATTICASCSIPAPIYRVLRSALAHLYIWPYIVNRISLSALTLLYIRPSIWDLPFRPSFAIYDPLLEIFQAPARSGMMWFLKQSFRFHTIYLWIRRIAEQTKPLGVKLQERASDPHPFHRFGCESPVIVLPFTPFHIISACFSYQYAFWVWYPGNRLQNHTRLMAVAWIYMWVYACIRARPCVFVYMEDV